MSERYGVSEGYYDSPETDKDFAQIAIDVYGNGVRDNSFEELVNLGRNYH